MENTIEYLHQIFKRKIEKKINVCHYQNEKLKKKKQLRGKKVG